MINYCVGFCFDENRQVVVLIQKNKPQWQAGQLNGVGGKIEAGEEQVEAMRREFKEETGVDIPVWEHYALLMFPEANLYVYRAFNNLIFESETQEEEEVSWYHVNDLIHGEYKVIPNLRWLIPLALENTRDVILVNQNV
jgi:8-oxo-dGTP diphosphatase